jgi:hypothetical protein
MAYERIKSGLANRMLAGSTSRPYIWGGFDALRVCTLNIIILEQGTRPMSAEAHLDLFQEVERVLCFRRP